MYIPLLFLSITVNYSCGLIIDQSKGDKRKLIFLVGILWNIGVLIFFKYIIYQLLELTEHIFNISSTVPNIADILFPLGISFYTFKAMTYIFDVYRGHATATKSFLNIAAYIAMFPQIVAGPIVRYKTIANEIKERYPSSEDLNKGSKLFIIGLASKVMLANQFAVYADKIFSKDPITLSVGLAWLGSICYTFQIYFDFAGYSLMAIGVGRLIGFNTPDNFNCPYLSRSVTEFWRRWHITLSSWFKNYLYIPLGGNQRGKFITYRNLFIVFLLCGAWHGSNITFLVWGIYHGLFLIIERWLRDNRVSINLPRLICNGYLIIVVTIGWVIFRSENIGYALDYLGVMFGMISPKNYYSTNMFSCMSLVLLTFIGVLCSSFNEYSVFALEYKISNNKGKLIIGAAYAITFVACIVLLSIQTYNPFIYARF
jgi:alginate O-acetyltransferase complex protein AlgI